MASDPRADIKARLQASLFGTLDQDGNPVEQYITHVKILEDSANPSAPAGTGADTSNRKERCIVISVQKNGIVRLHKARRNANGTYSIGKTWGMDQLEKLEETDNRGFIITIQKPYYWMTETSKEKYAFVTALIQVYRKFTGKDGPEIVGFDSIFRQLGSQNTQRTTPPSNAYATAPPRAQTNPYANPPLPYTATSPPQPQSNSYVSPPSNPYAGNTRVDPYATSAVAPLRPQRLPSESSLRRPQMAERMSSRESSKGSPERSRSREKQSRDINSGGQPIPPQSLNISRQTSVSSNLRSAPSETLVGGYDSSSVRSRRQQDDDTSSIASLNSTTSSRTGRVGPRAMASTPTLKSSSAVSSQRALAESPLPGRPGSAGGSIPPANSQARSATPTKHGPKLSISTSTSLPSKLQNGEVMQAPETPAPRIKSPLRKRPRSIDESAPSEETLSAAMVEIESLLTSFDWTHPTACATRLETLLTDELESVQSDNVHALVMNDGLQMQELVTRLDDGIKQCEELDEMLTLYLVELQALADDINFIESENRGLHVRTANERALEKELSELLNAMSISSREFDVLKQESLEKPEGIDHVEQSLLQVYLALRASFGLADQADSNGPKENMQIVREMKRITLQESEKFLARLKEFVKIKFQAELMSIPPSKSKSIPTFPDHSTSYSYFYRYAGFILFAKEVDTTSYTDIQQLYLTPASKSYREDFRAFVTQWKSLGRKATSDDLELIFSMVKEPQSTVSAIRSASIKRTSSVAKTLRSTHVDGSSRADKERERNEQEGKRLVGEIFDEILSAVVPAIVKEQSFVMEFLQLSPNNKYTYEQFLSATDKKAWLRSLEKRRPPELDKAIAKDVSEAMEQLLSWLPDELSSVVEWCRTSDALQLVSVMGVLEKHIHNWEDTDQNFVVKTLNKQHEKLGGLFHRFVEEQVRAIEDMKVTAKRRQGILLMFKIFPGFMEKVELQFESPLLGDGLDVREKVNEAYGKISKSMIDSLQAIAKDTTSHHASGSKDDDDKEQLNSHISMIENMHYYRETVADRGNSMLVKFKANAQSLFDEHLGIYLKIIIRRPLGRLLDFLQGVETFVQSNPSEDVTTRVSFSKSAFKKVLSHYDTKELRKGIDLLHRRVEKHFGQVPDESDALYSAKAPAIAKALVQEVWKECQKEYSGIVELCKRVISNYYPEGVHMEFALTDVNEAFSKRS